MLGSFVLLITTIFAMSGLWLGHKMTKLLQVSRLVVIFIKNLEFQEIFPVEFLQEPPEEGLPVVLSHLDADFLPGLVS